MDQARLPSSSDNQTQPVAEPTPEAPQRLLSLDTYRGGVMFFLAASSVALAPALIKALFPNSGFWESVSEQWKHVDWRLTTDAWPLTLKSWQGFRVWDLIQPSFMFMVGVSMPYSYGKRLELGQSYRRMFGHAVYRAILLILLGVFLRSLRGNLTYWTFEDVISQIGLGYVFLFLLWNRDWKTQAGSAAVLLVAYWALWNYWAAIAPLLGITHPVEGAWARVGNPGQALDGWLLSLFPGHRPPLAHDYSTLNFVPSLVTMIFGLMAGHLLRSPLSAARKLTLLIVTGIAGVVLGLAADHLGICPLIKKIWTPSWTLFSGGLCLLILAGFYWVIDVMGFRRWTLPFVVFGVNSIAIYILTWTWGGWLPENLRKHLNHTLLASMSDAWKNAAISVLAFGIIWLIFYWMYRRRIFLRI